MNDQMKESIDTLAEEIRSQARDLRVDTFLSLIYTSDLLAKYLDNILSDKPVTKAGYNILHSLILNDGTLTSTEISKRVWRTKYSVTKVIDTLEKQGYVTRASMGAGSDRRTKKIQITAKGLAHIQNATTTSRKQASEQLFRGLNEPQIAELNKLLLQLRKDTIELLRK
jgi:DNA-binding MarR family transcriptional regulator